jgi:Arc/MetJ-type ribon-helix-helix transcriptional regulator
MPKRRVSVTIDERMINWIDKKVEELVFATRSHAFEYAIKQLMSKEKEK